MQYILKKGNMVKKFGNCNEDLFEILNSSVDEALIITASLAIYFEKSDSSAMVCVEKSKAGLAKLKAKNLIKNCNKLDMTKLDDAFKLAEKVDSMSLEEVAKLMR